MTYERPFATEGELWDVGRSWRIPPTSVILPLNPKEIRPSAHTPPGSVATPLRRHQPSRSDAIRIAGQRREPLLPFTPDDLLNALFGDEIALTGVVGALLAKLGLTPITAREWFATFSAPAT